MDPLTSSRYPFVERNFGSSNFERLDHLPAASLGYRELGKVKIDCRFRLSKSKWGVLGEGRSPAGIVYMDLSFDQPKECRLSSATILVTLEESSPENIRVVERRLASSLQIMDLYGPKQLRGEQRNMAVRRICNLTPSVNILGNGAGGLGVDKEKLTTYESRWSFSGQLIPVIDKRVGGRSSTYRTLKWELTENDLDSQCVRNNIIHTGFTFEHEGKPFHLRVEINGKLQKTTDRMKKVFKFPSERRKGDGTSLTMVDLGPGHEKSRRLDACAERIPKEMEMENMAAIPVEMPDALPVSYQTLPPRSNAEGQFSSVLDGQSETLVEEDTPTSYLEDATYPSIENLAKALQRNPERDRRELVKRVYDAEKSEPAIDKPQKSSSLEVQHSEPTQSVEKKESLLQLASFLLVFQMMARLFALMSSNMFVAGAEVTDSGNDCDPMTRTDADKDSKEVPRKEIPRDEREGRDA